MASCSFDNGSATGTDKPNYYVPETARDNDSEFYLDFPCNYNACKYKQEHIKTWRELIQSDYEHFVELMQKHVPLKSRTFHALRGNLTEKEVWGAETSARVAVGEQSTEDDKKKFLAYVCNHKGKKNGLTWGTILQKHYNYFMWAVGNAMGRDTKGFRIYVGMLQPEHQAIVMNTPKGEVKVPYARKLGNIKLESDFRLLAAQVRQSTDRHNLTGRIIDNIKLESDAK
jgi:hypothetical protein